jgi:hypothetical protein
MRSSLPSFHERVVLTNTHGKNVACSWILKLSHMFPQSIVFGDAELPAAAQQKSPAEFTPAELLINLCLVFYPARLANNIGPLIL